MTRQATDQLYIDLEYFTPEEYYVYIAEAQASANTVAGLGCDTENIRGFDAALSSTATIAADAENIRGFECAIASSAAISCDADVLGGNQEAEADLTSEASISIDVQVIREFDAAVSMSTEQTAVVGVIFEGAIDVGALFSPAFDATAQFAGDALLESTANLEATASKFAGNEGTLENIVNLSLQSDRFRDDAAALTSTIEQATDAARFRDIEISLAASSSMTADVGVVKDSIVLKVGEFVLAADALSLQFGEATLESQAAFNALVEIFIPRTIPLYSRPRFLRASTSPFADIPVSTAVVRNGTYAAAISSTALQYRTEGVALPNINANEDFLISFSIRPTAITNSRTFFSIGNTAPNSGIQSSGIQISTTSIGILTIRVNGNDLNLSTQVRNFLSNGWKTINLHREQSSGDPFSKSLYVTVTNGPEAYSPAGSYTDEFTGSQFLAAIDTSDYAYFRNVSSVSGITYIDDFVFSKGAGIGANVRDSTTTVCNFDFETGTSRESLVLDQFGAASITSIAGIVAVPNFTVDGITIHQSSGTLTAIVGVSYENSIALNSDFQLAAEAEEVPIEFEAALLVESTQTVEAFRTQQGAADMVAESAVIADPYRILEFAVQTDAVFSELAAVVIIGQGLITCETFVNLTVDADKTAGISADISSQADLAAEAFRIQPAAADISSQFEQTATGAITFEGNSSQSSEYTLAADVSRIVGFESNIAANFTVDANVSGGFIGASAELISSSTQAITYERIRFADSSLNSTAELSITADRFAEMPAALSSESTQAVDYVRFRDFGIQTDAIFIELVAVAKTGAGLVTIDSVATLSADVNVIQGQAATLESLTNLAAEAAVTREFDVQASSESSLTAEGTTNVIGEGALSSQTLLTCDAVVTGVGSSALISVATVIDATPDVNRSVDAALSDLFTLTANALGIKDFAINAAANSDLEVEITVLVDSGSIDLGALFSPSVQYRVLRLDQYVYTVPREKRSHSIPRETRSYTIKL